MAARSLSAEAVRRTSGVTEEAARVPPGADGVLWAPYLMGERTPHCDPEYPSRARRASSEPLRAAHVMRAMIEGVAFSLRDTSHDLFRAEACRSKSIRLGGGGARSPLWRQIQAEVYGHAVEIVDGRRRRRLRRGDAGRRRRQNLARSR